MSNLQIIKKIQEQNRMLIEEVYESEEILKFYKKGGSEYEKISSHIDSLENKLDKNIEVINNYKIKGGM